jgi:hypothetical protein
MEIKTEEMMPYSTYYVPKGDYSRSNSSLNYNFDEMDTSFNEMDKLTKSLSRIEDKEAALNRTKSLDQSIFQLSGTCKDTNFCKKTGHTKLQIIFMYHNITVTPCSCNKCQTNKLKTFNNFSLLH